MISVLYVDDDESFCGYFKIYLERTGEFGVTTVRSGKSAIDMILSGSYDIVVSDYQMPGMNGIDLLRAYREKGSQVPFILFTGKGREEVIIEAINNGVAFYLQKSGDPVTLYAELAHKIRQAVRAEEALRLLRESEEQFRLLFETASDGILLLSDGIIQDCNTRATMMFQIERNTLIGYDFSLLAPEIQPDKQPTRNKLESIVHKTAREGGAFVRWKCRRLDNSLFDAEISINWLEIRGKVLHQAIIRDITERLKAEIELEQSNIDLSAAYQELMASEEEIKCQLNELRKSQEQLQESEKRYRDLADLLPEGVFECTLDGKITYVNREALTMFGYDTPPGPEINVIDFLSPQDRVRAMEILKEAIVEGTSRPHEYSAMRPDGSEFAVIIHSSQAVRHGVVVGLRGVVVDISERKRAEDEIRESKQQLADVIEFFPDATLVINTRGEVLFWNRAMEKMTHVNAEKILGKGNYEYSIPFYGYKRPILVDLALLPDTIVEEEYSSISRDGDLLIGEAFMPGLGLGTKWIWGVAAPLRNPEGSIVGAIECIRDITRRKEDEEALKRAREDLESQVEERTRELVLVNQALRESEERYRTLVELSPDAIFVHDGERILFSNPAGLKLLGAERMEEILHHSPLEFVHPDFISKAKLRLERSLVDMVPSTSEEEAFLNVHGETVPVEISWMPITFQGRKGILIVAWDIGVRKKTEAQLRENASALEDKNRELDFLTNRLMTMNRELDERVKERTIEVNRLLKQKDDFIYQLGHDLKTPLTPLIALLPQLVKDETDLEMRHLYSVFLRSVYSIREQTEKILTIARLSRQEELQDFDMISPTSLIRQSLEKNWLYIEKKNLHVSVTVPDNLVIWFSSRDLSSIFDNLINNAVKYSKEGGIIRISSETGAGLVKFIFEDDGIGLTGEEAGHVFDEFYMADKSRHDRQSSGLGLAIVKRILELHGGKVWVESEGKNMGARFTICIPLIEGGCSVAKACRDD
ncbi:MAG: PAS domain S-box protein [Methanomicrobiales archaeon]|nr:PAS domain S-box protein [Methanomicrobiales archaeon]